MSAQIVTAYRWATTSLKLSYVSDSVAGVELFAKPLRGRVSREGGVAAGRTERNCGFTGDLVCCRGGGVVEVMKTMDLRSSRITADKHPNDWTEDTHLI
jgi:hypothetical protein